MLLKKLKVISDKDKTSEETKSETTEEKDLKDTTNSVKDEKAAARAKALEDRKSFGR
jgi:hypothetical protein